MSGFFGAGVIPGGVVLGNLLGKGGQFGPIFFAAAPPLAGFVVQAGTGGVPGFSYNMVGWSGTTGIVGPSVVGSCISGSPAPVIADGSGLSFGDIDSGAGPLLALPPFFSVSVPGVQPLHYFASVTINSVVFSTSDGNVQYNNGGGDGPTIWGWNGETAGFVDGGDLAIVFA